MVTESSLVLRSPNYPGIDLQRAISHVGKIYEKAGLSAVSQDDAIYIINGKTSTGRSMTILSALNQFGLLEKNKKTYKVTDLAVQILSKDSSDQELKELLRKAAFKPKLYPELFAQLEKTKSKGALEAYLRNMQFTEHGVKFCIRMFLKTMTYLDMRAPNPVASKQATINEIEFPAADCDSPPQIPPIKDDGTEPSYKVDLPNGNILEIRMASKVSDKIFDEYVMRYFEMCRYQFVNSWENE